MDQIIYTRIINHENKIAMSEYVAINTDITEMSIFKTSWILHLYLILLFAPKEAGPACVIDRRKCSKMLGVPLRSVNKGFRILEEMGLIQVCRPRMSHIIVRYNPMAVPMPKSTVCDLFSKVSVI